MDRVKRNGHTSVIDGVEVKPKDWPGLLMAEISKLEPDGSVRHLICTATLIGPSVILTAAHCVDGRAGSAVSRIKLDLPDLPDPIPATCEMHPLYAAAHVPAEDTPRNSSDYALCKLETDLSTLPAYQMLEYDVIDRVTAPALEKAVLVTGYGCTEVKLNPSCKPIFGDPVVTMRAGNARISALPAPGPEQDYVQSKSKTPADAALCAGDSGGPLVAGATLQAPNLKRRLIGVNSSIAFPTCKSDDLVSRFSALATPEFRTFSDDWEQRNGKPVVCGVTRDAGKWPCRG